MRKCAVLEVSGSVRGSDSYEAEYLGSGQITEVTTK